MGRGPILFLLKGECLLKKRADGRYCKQVMVGYKPDGTRRMKTIYGTTIKEVEKKEREVKSLIEQGINICRDVTVSQWADEWIKTYKNNVSYYTLRRYQSIISIHIKPNIGNMKLGSVKLCHIQSIINKMDDYSESSVKKLRDTLHQMYVAAIANELAIKDPTVGLILNRKEQTARSILSEEEISNIRSFNTVSDCATFVITLLYTGLRRGEIAALTWDDIDFENNIIKVNKAIVFKNNRPIVSSPKTKNSIREIPMLDILREELIKYKEKYIEKYGQNITSKAVFLNNLGEPHTESSINKFWKRFLREYNEHYGTDAKFGMHQFRHTFCTMLYNAEVDIKTAQSVLGHSDVSVTLSIYTHLAEKQKKRSIDKLNDYVKNEMKTDNNIS